MDIFPTKHKAFTDVTLDVQKNKGVMLGGFSIKFEDLLAKAGGKVNANGDLNALAGRSVLNNIKERVEQPVASEKQKFESRDEAPRVERGDDSGHEQRAEAKDVRENDGDGRQQRHEDAPHDKNNDQKSAAKNDNDNARSENTVSAGDEAPEETVSVSSKAPDQGDKSGEQSGKAEINHGGADKPHAEEVIAGLLMVAQSAVVAGPVVTGTSHSGGENAQAQNSVDGLPLAVDAVGRQNSVEGLSSALAAVSGQHAVKDGDGPILQVGANSRQAQSGIAVNADAQTQGNAQNHDLPLPQEQVHAQVNVKDANASNAANIMTQQAAGLAKMVGEGSRLAVSVNVVNEDAAVVSQPGAALISSTLPADDGVDRRQSGQPSLQNQVAAPMTPAPINGVQAQNQAQQASGQAQSGSTAATEAKGPVQGAQSAANNGPQIQAAGGENMPAAGPSASSEAPQTLRSAAAQANNAHHVNMQKHAVIDQISVQITKAVNDGMDRINIQLRPENLGRVDVRLEVGHDGRTQALVIVDNKDTMELLQRDAKDLQRALEEAGLKLESDGLNFSLRGQKGQADDERDSAHGAGSAAGPAEDEDAESLAEGALAAAYGGGVREDGRVDIRA